MRDLASFSKMNVLQQNVDIRNKYLGCLHYEEYVNNESTEWFLHIIIEIFCIDEKIGQIPSRQGIYCH